MSAPLALALLGLAQLALAFLTDRVVGPMDHSVFARGLSRQPVNGIKDFFASTSDTDLGAMRTKTVLRIALLGATARSAVTALVVSLIGLVVTGVIVLSQEKRPELWHARAVADFVYAAVALWALILLFVRMGSDSLKPNPVVPANTTSAERRRALWNRMRDSRFLAPYLAAAFVGNVIVILTAIGL